MKKSSRQIKKDLFKGLKIISSSQQDNYLKNINILETKKAKLTIKYISIQNKIDMYLKKIDKSSKILKCWKEFEKWCNILFGNSSAKSIIKHELKHASVYKKYGVKYCFGFGIHNAGKECYLMPFVKPTDLGFRTMRQQYEVVLKSIKAVKDPSEYDLVILNHIKKTLKILKNKNKIELLL